MGGDCGYAACAGDLRGFNPRLHMGGDPIHGGMRIFILGFNPRLHMGGDLMLLSSHLLRVVSIHASTWEATEVRPTGTSVDHSFNPRLHMGGDLSLGVE